MKQEIRFCTTADGVRLAYATSGSGPPLIRVGHWLTHLERDWDSPVWRPWLVELSRFNTLVRYDQRGTGLSDRDVAEISFDTWLSDLETIVASAGLSSFALFGASQGVPIAIAYAVRHPQLVTCMVLYGGFTRGRLKRGSPVQQEEAELQLKLIRLGWGRDDPAFRQFFATQFLPSGTSEQLRWFSDLQRQSASPENAARITEVSSGVDVTALASGVTCPTLVLHPDGDARVPFEEGRRVASLIPGARFVPLESRNHIVLEHEPAWRRWVEEVRAFLPAGAPGHPKAFPDLTPRERELVELIAQGLDNAQVAARLSLSEKTVRNHITSIFTKLEVENRGQAIVLARDAGFGRKST